jgi:hypothetical protein
MNPTTKGTYCARAQVMRTERLIISVEMRPPKKGDLGWVVSMGADVKEALMQILDGRGSWDEGEYGYGVRAESDWPEIEGADEYEGRCVTVVISWDGTETGEVVLL